MSTFDPSGIYSIIYPLLLIFGYYLGRYVVVKNLLEKFRICIDNIDDAIKDNNISEEDFRKIWDTCYEKFIASLPPKMPPTPLQK